MDVVGVVGVPVMMTMNGSPPQRPALHVRAYQTSEDELERPAGFERMVGKVAVQANGDQDPASVKQAQQKQEIHPGHADVEDGQGAGMNQNEKPASSE